MYLNNMKLSMNINQIPKGKVLQIETWREKGKLMENSSLDEFKKTKPDSIMFYIDSEGNFNFK